MNITDSEKKILLVLAGIVVAATLFFAAEQARKNNLQGEKNDDYQACIQVITPARNPATGEVRDFPTPCDVPEGWEKVEREVMEDMANWKTYRNDELGFEFKYQDDWYFEFIGHSTTKRVGPGEFIFRIAKCSEGDCSGFTADLSLGIYSGAIQNAIEWSTLENGKKFEASGFIGTVVVSENKDRKNEHINAYRVLTGNNALALEWSSIYHHQTNDLSYEKELLSILSTFRLVVPQVTKFVEYRSEEYSFEFSYPESFVEVILEIEKEDPNVDRIDDCVASGFQLIGSFSKNPIKFGSISPDWNICFGRHKSIAALDKFEIVDGGVHIEDSGTFEIEKTVPTLTPGKSAYIFKNSWEDGYDLPIAILESPSSKIRALTFAPFFLFPSHPIDLKLTTSYNGLVAQLDQILSTFKFIE